MYKPKRSQLFCLCVGLEYSQSLGILTNQLMPFLDSLLEAVNSRAFYTGIKGVIFIPCTKYSHPDCSYRLAFASCEEARQGFWPLSESFLCLWPIEVDIYIIQGGKWGYSIQIQSCLGIKGKYDSVLGHEDETAGGIPGGWQTGPPVRFPYT